jgi:hypothetical protein
MVVFLLEVWLPSYTTTLDANRGGWRWLHSSRILDDHRQGPPAGREGAA